MSKEIALGSSFVFLRRFLDTEFHFVGETYGLRSTLVVRRCTEICEESRAPQRSCPPPRSSIQAYQNERMIHVSFHLWSHDNLHLSLLHPSAMARRIWRSCSCATSFILSFQFRYRKARWARDGSPPASNPQTPDALSRRTRQARCAVQRRILSIEVGAPSATSRMS